MNSQGSIVGSFARRLSETEPTWSGADEIAGQRGVGEVPCGIVGEAVLGLAVGDRSGGHLGAVVPDLGAHVVDAGRSGDRSCKKG